MKTLNIYDSLFFFVCHLFLNSVHMHFTTNKANCILEVKYLLVYHIFEHWYRLIAYVISHIKHFQYWVFLQRKYYWLRFYYSQETYLWFVTLKFASLHQILIFRQFKWSKIHFIGANKQSLIWLGKCDRCDSCSHVGKLWYYLFVLQWN